MKTATRDNVIYVATGLGLVALLIVDLVHFDRRGEKAWLPSLSTLRIAATGLVAAGLIVDTLRKHRVAAREILASVSFAICLHIVLTLPFRELIGGMSLATFSLCGVFETVALAQFTQWIRRVTL